MARKRFFLFILIITFTDVHGIDTKFVGDYFLDRGVKQIAVKACWDLFGKVKFARRLMQLDLRLSYLPTKDSVVSSENFFKVNYYKLGIFLDLDCAGSEEIFNHFDRLSFNETYFWMISTSDYAAAIEILETLPLSINAEIVVVVPDSSKTDSYTIYEVYNPSFKHGGKLNVTKIGAWDPQNGLATEFSQYKYSRRGNLNGMQLNLSVALTNLPEGLDMITYLEDPTYNKHVDSMHRYNYALMLQLRDYYNFSIHLTRGTTWGYMVNGTVNGILGDMVKGVVDISVTPFRWRKDRYDLMDYTVQTWQAFPAAVFRHPKKNELTNQFFKPFSREVWLFTTLVAFINWFLLYLITKLNQHFDKKEPRMTLDTLPASECAIITTAAVCQQGLSEGPKISSGRIVFLSLFLWAMMMFQFYSASIVGSLLSTPPRFLTTTEALLESSMEMGAEDIIYLRDFFSTDTDPVIKGLNKKKLSITKNRKKTYFTAEEGLKKVQKGDYAFMIDLITANKIIEDTFNDDEVCDLQEIYVFPPREAHVAVGIPKRSPFKKMITYGLRKIIENGLSRRLRNVWYSRRPQCPENHNSLPAPVALQEFLPVVFMLTAGAALAIFIMIAENLIRRHSRLIERCDFRQMAWLKHFAENQ